jgi:hypothetical protein
MSLALFAVPFLVVVVIALGWRRRALAAEAVKATGGPSTTSEVNDLRAWRERRAVSSIDHTLRHSVEAECDGDAAREILLLCCGGDEVSE